MVILIKTSEKEIMLGINLDSKLKYKDHVNFMCKKINQKLYVLDRIAPLMDVKRRKFHSRRVRGLRGFRLFTI